MSALGAVLPRIHAVQVPPNPHLPPRTRARQGEHFISQRAQRRRAIQNYQAGSTRDREELHSQVAASNPAWSAERVQKYLTDPGTTPLIEEAERVLEQLPQSTEPTGLVHNDIAIGDVIWSTGRRPVVIDWEGAGSGATGLDLGNARFELAMHYGVRAAETLLRGWTEVAGAPAPDDLLYWDLSATLNTPANLQGWAPMPHATEGRDAFITHVLRRVGATGASS
ncbi:phosphotransferase [Actinopolymorpha sp. B17G11]|uniref:phosphotransferase family protein n=1 Tax=Actinopolymorpha sp. B17G11 TaxID=3160861 RepID=UPI0032E3AE6A